MNRIKKLFQSKKQGVLSVFFTAGYPQLNDTERIARTLAESGVDMIEVGIPFSDPIADGPVIQESNRIALGNGMNVKLLLQQVRAIRNSVDIPVLLMGYLNPVLQFGLDRFCEEAGSAGADGMILPDLPVREYMKDYQALFQARGLANIFLVSPTTKDERIHEIDSVSDGFIYAVSSSSTTGTKKEFDESQQEYFKKLNEMKLKNPFLVGFGVSNRQTFDAVNRYAAGAIVGSAFIKALGKGGDQELNIREFVKSIKG